MGQEIERKFLVSSQSWRDAVSKVSTLSQVYLAVTDQSAVRVRIKNAETAFITIKSAEAGRSRAEFEYSIPVGDAHALFELRVGHVVEKRRHIVLFDGHHWEIDVFTGALEGLVMAELELDHAEQQFSKPGWLGKEVTDDRRYYNASLALNGLPQ